MKDPRRAVARRADFFASLLLLSSLLGFAGSVWWPFDLFAHFRAQYFLAGLVLLALALLRPGKTTAIPAFNVVLNGALFVSLYTGGPPRAPATAKPLSIVSFNLNAQNTYRDAAKAELVRLDADVIIALEVTPGWMKTLESLDGYDVVIARPASDNFGIAALSRVPTTSSTAIQHGAAMITSLSLTVPWEGDEIVVLGTHPVPPMSARFSRFRDEQLTEIAAWSAAEKRPHVVVGDLNATVWSSAFEKLVENGRLVDTTDGWTTTWPNGIVVLVPFQIPIDHALISPELAVVDRTVGNHAGSDHRPLRIRVTLREDPLKGDGVRSEHDR